MFSTHRKTPLTENANSEGIISVELPNRKNNHWRKCNKQSFDQTCKYKQVKCIINIMYTANDSAKRGGHYTCVSGRPSPLETVLPVLINNKAGLYRTREKEKPAEALRKCQK